MTIPYRWIAAALVALAALAGAFYEGDKHGAAVVQAAWDMERASISSVGTKAQATEDAKHDKQETAVAASDTNRTQEKSNALAEIDSHRATVASGAERVRVIAARCPARSDDVPQAAGSARSVDDAPVELNPAGGQDVLDLKAAVAADREKILFLQEYAAALQR